MLFLFVVNYQVKLSSIFLFQNNSDIQPLDLSYANIYASAISVLICFMVRVLSSWLQQRKIQKQT
jgi:hypothetical protein